MTKQTQNFSKNRHLQQEMLSRFCAEVATWTFIGNTWNNHIITSGKIRPFLNKQQLHLFPLKTYRFWRSWIFTFKLDFKPSITTASSENPANHLRSVQKEQAPSCQDCQKAMGRACSSAQLRPKPTEGHRSFAHRFRCNLPPSMRHGTSRLQPCLTGTLYCPVGCLQHQLMQRNAIQWNGYWYTTRFIDPNKGPQNVVIFDYRTFSLWIAFL